jgi:hypothetical protein
MSSKDVDELLSSTDIVREHFQEKADKVAVEEAVKIK